MHEQLTLPSKCWHSIVDAQGPEKSIEQAATLVMRRARTQAWVFSNLGFKHISSLHQTRGWDIFTFQYEILCIFIEKLRTKHVRHKHCESNLETNFSLLSLRL